MDDEQIISLFFQRKEAAIAQAKEKYEGLCRSVAGRILPDQRDVEECVSDVCLRVGNAIPPEHPRSLRAYLARITRNLALDDLAVDETTFRLDGVRYSYRTAATDRIEEDFADISGIDTEYQNQSAAQVGWCQAKLAYEDGGAGGIIWFDVAAGLLYSLSMDQGASESALLEMANLLFTPTQGDVG